MSEFTAEELTDAIDREVRDCLDRHGIDSPPVDAEMLANEEFDLRVVEIDPADEAEPTQGRFGPRPARRPRPREVVVRPDMTEEARQAACARACGRQLIPRVFHRLRVELDPDNRSGQAQLIALITPRLLLPTSWFRRDARKSGYDLEELKGLYPTAGYELIALRMLDITEEPCLMTVVDDGVVGLRRANCASPGRGLLPAEQRAVARVTEDQEPVRVRLDGWTVYGWPVQGGAFNRIVLRSLPDEI